MRIRDWSSDVCSSDLLPAPGIRKSVALYWSPKAWRPTTIGLVQPGINRGTLLMTIGSRKIVPPRMLRIVPLGDFHIFLRWNSSTRASSGRSEEHTSELQSLMRISYAVFCLKKKNKKELNTTLIQ